jgi:hypothetical protein
VSTEKDVRHEPLAPIIKSCSKSQHNLHMVETASTMAECARGLEYEFDREINSLQLAHTRGSSRANGRDDGARSFLSVIFTIPCRM